MNCKKSRSQKKKKSAVCAAFEPDAAGKNKTDHTSVQVSMMGSTWHTEPDRVVNQ